MIDFSINEIAKHTGACMPTHERNRGQVSRAICWYTMGMTDTISHTPTMVTTVVTTDLDGALDGATLAGNANYSRFHFQRLFREQTGETPGDCRRRLRLERAAHQLQQSTLSITEIAFDALYDSLEGFSRAFRRAYGVAPSRYRQQEPLSWFLAAPNDIHFDPVVGAAVRLASTHTQGGTMDLTDRLLEHDLWLMQQLLDKASALTDEQLDAPLAHMEQLLSFESTEKSLRELLDRLVFTKEVWVAAVQGRQLIEIVDRTPRGMRQRLDAANGEFLALARRVRDENLWDTEFIDMLCEPPETFTYGGMIAHVINVCIYRRLAALHTMKRLGVAGLDDGCPLEYEMKMRG